MTLNPKVRSRFVLKWIGLIAWGFFLVVVYGVVIAALVSAAYDLASWVFQLGVRRHQLWPFLAEVVWPFLRLWGGALGLIMDVSGAMLVYLGVKISHDSAWSLEWYEVHKIPGVTNSALLERQRRVEQRAAERVRASQWGIRGLILFIGGFVLQLIGSWPKS